MVVYTYADVSIVINECVQFVFFSLRAYFHALYVRAAYTYIGYVFWFEWVHLGKLVCGDE